MRFEGVGVLLNFYQKIIKFDRLGTVSTRLVGSTTSELKVEMVDFSDISNFFMDPDNCEPSDC